MDALSKARVEANLRRWAAHGLEARNPDHVAAYMLARQQQDRPRPEHVLAVLATRTQKHTQQATMTTDFWLVPRGGWQGEPPWARDWCVTEEHLRQNFQVPEETDLSAVWIVDAGCPRHALGKGVKRMAFQDRVAITMLNPPNLSSSLSSAALAPTPSWTPASGATLGGTAVPAPASAS